MATDEWKKLNRELKILQAKQSAGGTLHPKDKARLAWLQERLGEAEEVKRISLDEPVDSGPKTTTSDDHYATEMSEQLLRKAERQKLEKAYEKENIGKQKRGFEARDYRKGRRTFKQEGLSTFAIEASEDMKAGELGLAETPAEEEQGAQKMDHRRAVYAQDESERLTKKSKGKKSNPFALDISDGLASGLDSYANYEDSAVPDQSSKSFAVDDGDAALLDVDDRRPMAYEEVDQEVEVLLHKSYDLDKKGDGSRGAKTTFEVTNEDDALDVDLVQQAVQHAESAGLVDEEQHWAVDDDGNEAVYVQEPDEPEFDLAAGQKMPKAPPARRARFSDEAPTTPGVVETDDDETKDYDMLAAAIQAEEHGRPSSPAPDPDDVLIPEPPDLSDDSPGVLIPDPPDMSDDSAGILIPDPPEPEPVEEEIMIPVPPEPDPATPELYEPSLDDEIPDLSDDKGIDLALDVGTTAPAAAEPSADLEADQFWGLSEGDRGSVQESKPAPPPPPPRPAPARPPSKARAAVTKPHSQPLPAFSFSAEKVVPAAPPPKPKRQQVRVSAPPASSEPNNGSFLNDLFDDASPAPAKASGPAPIPFASLDGRPQAAREGERVNDLAGPRRATVHFKDGVNRRGVIANIDTDADMLRLDPQPGSGAAPEELVALSLKAIFLMLPRGTARPQKDGTPARIVLIDGRKLEGFTPDYDPRRKAFTLFPKDDRGNIERVIVFNDAIKNIWFDE